MATNKELLLNLQSASIPVQETAQQVTTTVLATTAQSAPSCATKGTDSVTIDSNSFGDDNCADIDLTFVNGTEFAQILRFGAPGQAGLYQKLNMVADASNVAGVTADAGDGAQPNVLPLQAFNWLTQDGIVVTGMEVEILAGGNPQAAQKLTLNRQSPNVTDKCKTTRVKPSCSECINDNDPQTYFYRFCRMWDSYNSADYTLIAGGSVNIKIHYAGLATAKGIVACAGANKGQVVTQIVQTA